MRDYHRLILAACCGMLVQLPLAHADELKVSASAVSLSAGAQAKVTVSGAKGTVRVASASASIATAAYAGNTITITGVASGRTKVNVSDREHQVTVAVTVTGVTAPPPPGNSTLPWRVLASNDLGMHCADLDCRIFSILPPFNVVHAQVVQTGTATAKPRLLSGADADVPYRATSSSVDPAGAGSINTTSNLAPAGTKSNFWASATLPNGNAVTLGGLAYRSLYPNAVLDLFAPIPVETGLPVPDPVKLPAMPLPKSAGRTPAVQAAILDQTCYQCHPGKQTKCLRGAMGAGGVVCQDCQRGCRQAHRRAGLPLRRKPESCRTCHGLHGEGTPLARVAATRTLRADDDGIKTITLQRGTPARCDACHENKL